MGSAGTRVIWPVVLREHAAHDILVNLDAEDMRNLLGNADTAEFRIAALHLDDCRNKFGGGTFRARLLSPGGGGKEQLVLAIDQGLVELQ